MPPESPADDLELVKLGTVETAIAAQVIEGLLTDQEIPSQLVTWHSTALDGIFESQKGYAEIRVHRRDLARAREVLADFERAEAAMDADSPDPN